MGGPFVVHPVFASLLAGYRLGKTWDSFELGGIGRGDGSEGVCGGMGKRVAGIGIANFA